MILYFCTENLGSFVEPRAFGSNVPVCAAGIRLSPALPFNVCTVRSVYHLFCAKSGMGRVPSKKAACALRDKIKTRRAAGTFPRRAASIKSWLRVAARRICERSPYGSRCAFYACFSRAVVPALGQETARTMRRFQARKRSKPHRGFAKKALSRPFPKKSFASQNLFREPKTRGSRLVVRWNIGGKTEGVAAFS